MFKKGDLVRVLYGGSYHNTISKNKWWRTHSTSEIERYATEYDTALVINISPYKEKATIQNFTGGYRWHNTNQLQLIKEQDHDDIDQPRFAGEPEHQPVDGTQAGPDRD